MAGEISHQVIGLKISIMVIFTITLLNQQTKFVAMMTMTMKSMVMKTRASDKLHKSH